MKLTKTAIKQIQVEERKKSREKQKQSEFMKRTSSIYNGQKKRAADLGATLPFTLDQFRDWLRPFVEQKCACDAKMTIKGLAVDHQVPIARGGEWALSNLASLCKPCNFRKGQLLPEEFKRLCEFANTLSPASREDLWRRLTLGGKWSFGGK